MEKIKNKHELDLREQDNRDKEVDAKIESLKEKDKRELLKINNEHEIRKQELNNQNEQKIKELNNQQELNNLKHKEE